MKSFYQLVLGLLIVSCNVGNISLNEPRDNTPSKKYNLSLNNLLLTNSKLVPGDSSESITHLAQTLTGWVVVGVTDGDAVLGNDGGSQAFVRHFDKNLDVEWTYVLDSSGEEVSSGVVVDSNGYIYAAFKLSGTLTTLSSQGMWDYGVIKLDPSGNEVWKIQDGTTNDDYVSDIIFHTPTSQFLISGRTTGSLHANANLGGEDCFAVGYNLDGSRNWTRTLGTSLNDTCNTIEASDDKVFLGFDSRGTFNSHASLGVYDVHMVGLSILNGNYLWSVPVLAGTLSDRSSHLKYHKETNTLALCGFTFSSYPSPGNRGSRDIYVQRLNPEDGNVIWTKYLGGTLLDICTNIQVDSKGAIYVLSEAQDGIEGYTSPGPYDFHMTKYKPNGEVDSEYFAGGTGEDKATDFRINESNGEILVIGGTTSNDGTFFNLDSSSLSDGFLLKFQTN